MKKKIRVFNRDYMINGIIKINRIKANELLFLLRIKFKLIL